jgi:hypothetical protein
VAAHVDEDVRAEEDALLQVEAGLETHEDGNVLAEEDVLWEVEVGWDFHLLGGELFVLAKFQTIFQTL